MAPEAAYASQIEFSKQVSEDHEAFRIRHLERKSGTIRTRYSAVMARLLARQF